MSDDIRDCGKSGTNHVSGLINDFQRLTGRACFAALMEADSAEHKEKAMANAIDILHEQLEERDADLQAKDEAIKRLDTIWKARWQKSENCVKEKDAELANRDGELKRIRAEAEQLSTRLVQAEKALERLEAARRQIADRFEAEIATLRLQLLSKELCLEEKTQALEKARRS